MAALAGFMAYVADGGRQNMSVCLSTYLKFLFRLLVGAWIFYRLFFVCAHVDVCIHK